MCPTAMAVLGDHVRFMSKIFAKDLIWKGFYAFFLNVEIKHAQKVILVLFKK